MLTAGCLTGFHPDPGAGRSPSRGRGAQVMLSARNTASPSGELRPRCA